MENKSQESNQSYSHILQKVGVLKTFTVAKVVSRKEINDLKKLVRAVAKTEKEYKQLLKEEMSRIGNMHDSKNPIPGIIYGDDDEKNQKNLFALAKEYAKNMKEKTSTKRDLCYLIAALIKELGLTQEDFMKLNQENDEEDDE